MRKTVKIWISFQTKQMTYKPSRSTMVLTKAHIYNNFVHNIAFVNSEHLLVESHGDIQQLNSNSIPKIPSRFSVEVTIAY